MKESMNLENEEEKMNEEMKIQYFDFVPNELEIVASLRKPDRTSLCETDRTSLRKTDRTPLRKTDRTSLHTTDRTTPSRN